jgi:hypothetical protein
MKKKIELFNSIPFFWRAISGLLLVVTAGLFIASLFLPPEGIIDRSVLIAGGILMTPLCFFCLLCIKAVSGVEIDLKNKTLKLKTDKNETNTQEN